MPAVSFTQIQHAVRAAGLGGRAVCVHSSLRSFGRVEGGADTVVDALLAEGCTVLVPTFTTDLLVEPPPGLRRERNGWDYDRPPVRPLGGSRVYRPQSDHVEERMGAIPRAVLARRDRARGDHPLCSFAAVGPLAARLAGGQTPLDVLAPLRALVDADGLVVLMGVGLEQATFLHLSEREAGRRLFRRWANGPDGKPIEVEVGGCSHGFGALGEALLSCTRKIEAGLSTWLVLPVRPALGVAAAAIRRDPSLTHCGDPECHRCNDAVVGGPILDDELLAAPRR